MKRQLWGVLLSLTCAFLTCAQSPVVKVKFRVLLVDSQLNQKPVPFVLVTLKGPGNSAGITEMKTGLDGTAEKDLPAGKYLLAVSKAVDFDGKRYHWDMEVNLADAAQTILLSNDNAKIENAPAVVNVLSGSDLSEQFKRLKNSVVTVLTESGHGTGFFVDAAVPQRRLVTDQTV
jgi:hypothetical protein